MSNVPEMLAKMRAGLIVSCQAYPGEPMRSPEVMRAIAQAAVIGGAVGIRAQGLDDLRAMRPVLPVPLVGLIKRGETGVFITPTLADALACVAAGADIVAIDGTRRPRPDQHDLHQVAQAVHDAGALVMADCGSVADAEAAVEAGADCIATTLAGYTGDRPLTQGPDLELVQELTRILDVPVVAEGRIRTPAEAAACLRAGAFTVTVGTAITHPTSLTAGFVRELAQQRPDRSLATSHPGGTEAETDAGPVPHSRGFPPVTPARHTYPNE